MLNVLACIVGVVVGFLTGLLPGLHVNLAVFIVLGAGLDAVMPAEPVTIFVVSLAMTQVFVSFIPAVFLRIPAGDNAVAVFPGDRLLGKGEGPSAVVAAQTGGMVATLFASILAICFFLAVPTALPWIEGRFKPYLGFVLLGILGWFVLRDLDFSAARLGRGREFLAHASLVIVAFVLLAQLSEVALSGVLLASDQGITAAFSGMFGAATLLGASWGSLPAGRPPQITQSPAESIPPSAALAPGLIGAAGGTAVGLLPAVGTAEMSAALCGISDRMMPESTRRLGPDRRYLMMVGAVGAADAMLAIAAIFLVGKARSGASIGVEHLLGDRISASSLDEVRFLFLRLIGFGLIAAFAAFHAGRLLANLAGQLYSRLDPRAFSRAVPLGLAVLIMLSCGVTGLMIYVAATAIGLLLLRLGVRPASMMAFLLIPSVSFFLGTRLPALPPIAISAVAIHSLPDWKVVITAWLLAMLVGACSYRWCSTGPGSTASRG
jgi:putative membrane protein